MCSGSFKRAVKLVLIAVTPDLCVPTPFGLNQSLVSGILRSKRCAVSSAFALHQFQLCFSSLLACDGICCSSHGTRRVILAAAGDLHRR